MTVAELITKFQEMPQECHVRIYVKLQRKYPTDCDPIEIVFEQEDNVVYIDTPS